MTTNKNENITLWALTDEERKERFSFPWKRILARLADLVFCLLLWWTVAYLAFRWNVLLLHWIPGGILMFLISLALMIVLEPVFLSIFGTTPGKAIFGMKIRSINGAKPSLKEGYLRIFHMLSRGCGYVIIPVYNLFRLYRGYKDCQVNGVTEWDEGFVYTSKGNLSLRTGLAIVFAGFVVLLMATVYYGADMPVNRGDLTPDQLSENVESYWKFHGTDWNVELFYTVNLQFYERSAGFIFDRMDPPEVVFEEKDGVVTGLGFEFEDESRMVLMALPVWLRGYTTSFVGARQEMNFVKLHSPSGPLNMLLEPAFTLAEEREGERQVQFTSAGVEVFLHITAGETVSVSFSLRKI